MIRIRAFAVDWTVVQREISALGQARHVTRSVCRAILIHLSNSPAKKRRAGLARFAPGQAPSPVFFIEAPGRPVFPSPLRMRGDGAPGGAAVVGSISASPCGDAEAPPGAPPEHLSMPGLICGRLLPLRPHVVNGTAAPGRAFRVAVLIGGFPIRGCRSRRPSWVAVDCLMASPARLRASLNGCTVSQLLAGGSYWPPGGAPAPPECLGGAFVSRPRAPHPAPSSDASMMTPLDRAGRHVNNIL